MHRDHPPPPIAGWVAGRIGAADLRWFEHSQDHRQSRVWAVRRPGDDGPVAFLKVHRHHRKFTQERDAYRLWLGGCDATPRLLACDESTRSLLLTPLAGDVVERGERSGKDIRRCYREAGRFLRWLHDRPHEDTDPLPPAAAFTQRSTHWLAAADGLLKPSLLAAVAAQLAESGPLNSLPRRPCHRDYSPRNWVDDGLRVAVIDFEHARADLAVVDIERVLAAPLTVAAGADATGAFLEGYGGPLSSHETAALRLVRLQSSLSRVAWGVRHGDAAFEARGRRELTQWFAGDAS